METSAAPDERQTAESRPGRSVCRGFTGCSVMAALGIHITLACLGDAARGVSALEAGRSDGVGSATRACSVALTTRPSLLAVTPIGLGLLIDGVS